MIFENSEIDLTDLPKVEKGTFQQLDENYLTVKYVGLIVFFLILSVGLLFAFIFTDFTENPYQFYIAAIIWLLWAIASFVLTKMGYNIRGFMLRDKDIIHRQGVIFRNRTSIPFNRVQHCEINQGPIQRIFDLHTLQIFTAGGSNSDLSIPGLKGDKAQQIKEFILKKTVEQEETEQDEELFLPIQNVDVIEEELIKKINEDDLTEGTLNK